MLIDKTDDTSFKVSVIIPVYNAEKYIQRAVESVLIQQEVTELILVDDGSADESVSICKYLQNKDNRIIILQHEANKNKGVSATRNLGIKKASNNYIAFLDADDYYLPHRFFKTKKIFLKDKSIEGVYEMIGVLNNENIFIPYSTIRKIESEILFENLQPVGAKVWFHINGLTINKNCFFKTSFFDETLKTSEDTLQWFKIAATCKLVSGNISTAVALHEKTHDSLSSNSKQVKSDFILMLLKLFQYCVKTKANNVRKEIVLKTLFFHASKNNWRHTHKFSLFSKVFFTSPIFILKHSSSFRQYFGNLIGYNNVLNFLNRRQDKI